MQIMRRQTSNISHSLVGNRIVDHSDVDLISRLNTWLQWIGQRERQDETRNIYILWFAEAYICGLTVHLKYSD